jgi:hypothetical protein
VHPPAERRRLTVVQQYAALSGTRICAGKGRLHRDRLIWVFDARPTPISRRYTLQLRYADRSVPQVVCVAPDLNQLAEGKRLPHVYEQRPPRLCLHLPRAGEWTPEMLIATTIVPWAVLWLLYFEDWLATNEWHGGGVHPDEKEKTA